MSKCDLSVEFLNRLNTLIKTLNDNKTPIGNKLDKIKDKIDILKQHLTGSEARWKEKINTRKHTEEPKHKIVYEHKKNRISQISSPNVQSHICKKYECSNIPCNDIISQIPSFNYQETRYINSIDELKELELSEYFLVDAFRNDQRTYNGFLCFIAVLNEKGILFIIDLLKYREGLIELGFLSCKYKKIFVSPKAYYCFVNDYKDISCYLICDFNQEPSLTIDDLQVSKNKKDSMKIDWRIRPVDQFMKFTCQLGIVRTIPIWNKFLEIYSGQFNDNSQLNVKKKDYNLFSFASMLNKKSDEYLKSLLQKISNKRSVFVKYQDQTVLSSIMSGNTIEYVNSIFKITNSKHLVVKDDEDILLLRPFHKDWYGLITKFICHRYNLTSSKYLEKLIKHREHVAMDNNVSIFSVASNEMISQIYKHKPTTIDSYKDQLGLESSLLKSNFHGFLFSDEKKVVREKRNNIKFVKLNKSKDIRGNTLQEKEYFRRKKQLATPKFTYRDDLSDIELEETTFKEDTQRPKRKHKKIKTKGKIENMLQTMDIKDKYIKRSQKRIAGDVNCEVKIDNINSEPCEVLKEKKKKFRRRNKK